MICPFLHRLLLACSVKRVSQCILRKFAFAGIIRYLPSPVWQSLASSRLVCGAIDEIQRTRSKRLFLLASTLQTATSLSSCTCMKIPATSIKQDLAAWNGGSSSKYFGVTIGHFYAPTIVQHPSSPHLEASSLLRLALVEHHLAPTELNHPVLCNCNSSTGARCGHTSREWHEAGTLKQPRLPIHKEASSIELRAAVVEGEVSFDLQQAASL